MIHRILHRINPQIMIWYNGIRMTNPIPLILNTPIVWFQWNVEIQNMKPWFLRRCLISGGWDYYEVLTCSDEGDGIHWTNWSYVVRSNHSVACYSSKILLLVILKAFRPNDKQPPKKKLVWIFNLFKIEKLKLVLLYSSRCFYLLIQTKYLTQIYGIVGWLK